MLTAVKTGSILRIQEHSNVGRKKKVVMVQLLPSFLSPQLKVLTTCEWENELRHSSSGQTLTFLKKKERKKERKQLR